jgi:hypothetical protein
MKTIGAGRSSLFPVEDPTYEVFERHSGANTGNRIHEGSTEDLKDCDCFSEGSRREVERLAIGIEAIGGCEVPW